MNNLFQNINKLFLPKEGIADKPKLTILIGFAWVTHLFAWVYVATSYVIGYRFGVTVMTITALCFALLLFLIKKGVGYEIAANIYIAVASIIAIFPSTLYSGGLYSGVLPWFGMIPVVSMLLLGYSKQTIFWLLYSMAAIGWFYMIDAFYQPFPTLFDAPKFNNLFFLICQLGLIGILFVVIRLFQRGKDKAIQLRNEKNQELENTLVKLKTTQTQLIQTEKLASLGELTAGIAHEIQNPLNFVNNFSEINKELIEELLQELLKPIAERDGQQEMEILNDIRGNAEKINLHGKRADAIVKGMLQHSRTSIGTKEPTNINALADEYLRLAYHGMRARDKSFNAEMKTDFDNGIDKINIISQDIGRVLLNLYNNAFYAVSEKLKAESAKQDAGYKPLVTVQTRRLENQVSITVNDNGNGIPQHVVGKIFQPFFTTKPTGKGTGLGLSLSYDFVKAHAGELKVETKEGEGTSFIIQLPV